MKDAKSGNPGTETMEIHKVELSGLQVASNQGEERLAREVAQVSEGLQSYESHNRVQMGPSQSQ